MVQMKYNKAVRDKIPEIIRKSGHGCEVEKLSNTEFLVKLEEKLLEEILEYQHDKNPEELADILEIIYRITKLKGISKDMLEEIRIKKAKDRGAFEKNLYLVSVNSDGK